MGLLMRKRLHPHKRIIQNLSGQHSVRWVWTAKVLETRPEKSNGDRKLVLLLSSFFNWICHNLHWKRSAQETQQSCHWYSPPHPLRSEHPDDVELKHHHEVWLYRRAGYSRCRIKSELCFFSENRQCQYNRTWRSVKLHSSSSNGSCQSWW